MNTHEKTFPLRTAADLSALIKDAWDVDVTEHELTKPSAEIVQSIYCAILADVLSLDVQKFERDRQVAIGDTEFPEYYYDATTLQMLLYHMARVAKIAKAKTFTMRDLTRPDGPRTIRILSAIANFKAFAENEDRLQFLENLQHDAEDTQSRYDARKKELESLQHEVEDSRMALEADLPAVRAIQRETDAIQKQQDEKYSYARELQREGDRLKASKAELTAQLRQRAVQVQELHRSNVSEKGRLVKSPERIKQRIVDMTASSEALKPQIAKVEALTRNLQAKMEVLHLLNNDTKDVTKDLQIVETDLAELQEKTATIERLQASLAEKQAESKTLEALTGQSARQRQNALDKLQRTRQLHEEKQEIAKAKHEDLQRRHQELAKQRSEREAETSEQKEIIDRIIQEQNKYIADSQAEIDLLLDEHYRLEKVIAGYMSDLDKNLGLGFYSKHTIPAEDQKKVKRRKKEKAAVPS